jgi:hypothetical protein
MSKNMTEKNFRKKYLICGCCGQYFYTWKGYIDQDQDKGFGICESCQKEAEKREVKMINDSIKIILPNLKPENQAKIKKMSINQKRNLVLGLIDKDVLRWGINN